MSRGKSDTPPSSVSTDDSRNLRELRNDDTQSAYDTGPGAEAVVAISEGGGGRGTLGDDSNAEGSRCPALGVDFVAATDTKSRRIVRNSSVL